MTLGIRQLAVAAVAVAACVSCSSTEPPVEGGRTITRLMSAEQYTNSVGYIFGPKIAPSVRLPPFRRVEGLIALGAHAAGMSAGGMEATEQAARAVADGVVKEGSREFLLPCSPQSNAQPDDNCAADVLKHYGRLMFRRSLSDDELKSYVAIAHNSAVALKDFYRGLSASFTALLVAPEFLHVIETAESDPRDESRSRLTAESKASRLSLLLWNALPDEELIAAAESGELHKPKVLEKQVERMLASPRVEDGLRAFFADMLMLEQSESLTKDGIIYPAFSQHSALAAREQTLLMIVDHVLTNDADYRDLFTSRKTFVDPSLSPLYKEPVGSTSSNWAALELPEGRAGLLSQISFLTINAHPGRSSPTRRGRALREIFLCQHVPDAPPNVDFSGFENADSGAKTARGRMEAHSGLNPACAGCHRITDPMGLALENFDGAGQFRTTEGGEAINSSGSLDGTQFSDAAGLGRALHDHPALSACLVKRLYNYGLGFDPGEKQRAVVDQLSKQFAEEDNYRVLKLLQQIATSPAFYAVSAPAKASANSAS